MPKKKQRITLHMHQLQSFIDNRYEFYESYFNNRSPRHYSFKGVQKAFQVGDAIDHALKQFYLNLNDPNELELDHGIYDSEKFSTLPTSIDQTMVLSVVGGYIMHYAEEKATKEYFKNYAVQEFKVPFIFNNINTRRLKYKYIIHARPDLLAYMYNMETGKFDILVIIEFKTFGEDEKKYSAETLDFQTMCYAWASYRWNFKIPKYVIKRSLGKPRIRQKKTEDIFSFQKRMMVDVVEKDKQYFKSGIREINKDMVINFENYLTEIICELDAGLKNKKKYKFWKKSNEYWGL